ncbi:MAG: ATP-binding protein [Candidatus Eremiobacteraeota bacterium]|nr:ATP-binding protein [Candidatus Eremiobacteraeota bacterium]
MKVFQRHFGVEYESVSEARQAIAQFAGDCGFDGHEISDIALAVGEACNNAVEHSRMRDPGFKVTAICDQRRLQVEIEDSGFGFELAGKGGRMDPEQRGTRGLGIFLMRAIMDDVNYKFEDSGTTVVLTKRRHIPGGRLDQSARGEDACKRERG